MFVTYFKKISIKTFTERDLNCVSEFRPYILLIKLKLGCNLTHYFINQQNFSLIYTRMKFWVSFTHFCYHRLTAKFYTSFMLFRQWSFVMLKCMWCQNISNCFKGSLWWKFLYSRFDSIILGCMKPHWMCFRYNVLRKKCFEKKFMEWSYKTLSLHMFHYNTVFTCDYTLFK